MHMSLYSLFGAIRAERVDSRDGPRVCLKLGLAGDDDVWRIRLDLAEARALRDQIADVLAGIEGERRSPSGIDGASRVALFFGHNNTRGTPTWIGTLGRFREENPEMTADEYAAIVVGLETQGHALIGGGAQAAFTMRFVGPASREAAA